MQHPHRKFLAGLSAAFALVFGALAIAPLYRADWLLENWLVFGIVAVLAGTFRTWPLSRGSYVAIFTFLCLHEIGSHYTYSEVPYDAWFDAIGGRSLNSLLGWERNHYDRLVHFVYGAAIAYPMRELTLHIVRRRGFWSYFLTINLMLATSTWYELIEWAAAVVFGGELGMAYLGTQGDVWDAQWDTALAGLGATLCMALVAATSATRRRDYAADWVDALRSAHALTTIR